MFAELFRNSPLLVLPVIGLGIFATLYAAAIAVVFSRGASEYKKLAELPLESSGENDDDRCA